MAERVPFASELSRIMERVACEVTRHVGQLELRPVLDENFPAETGGCQVQTTLYGGYHSRITLTSNYLFFFNLAKNMMEESPTLEDVAGWLELGYAPLPMTEISAKHEGEEKEL